MLLRVGWWVRCLERIVGSVDIYGIPISEEESSNFALWLPVRFFTPLRCVQNDMTECALFRMTLPGAAGVRGWVLHTADGAGVRSGVGYGCC